MRSRVLVAVLVPALSLALAACGPSAVDSYAKVKPATIDQDMRDALNSMTSVHVHTTYTDAGSTFTMDASIDNAGRCIAAVTDGTQTLSLVALDTKTIYAKGSADFWIQSENASMANAAMLANQWITGFPSTLFSETCDLKALVKPFTANTVAQDNPTYLGKTMVQGRDAVQLQIAVGSGTATVAVAAAKPHYALSVLSANNKRTEILSDFNAPVKPTAPPGATDISQLAPTQ